MNRYTSVDSVDDIHIHNSLGGTMDSQVAIFCFLGLQDLESISEKSLIMFAADLNFLLVLQKIALIPDFSSPRFLFFYVCKTIDE